MAAAVALPEPAGGAVARREPGGREQLADEPASRARVALETASAARWGREAPATPEFAAGQLAVPAVRALATAVQAWAIAVRASALPTAAPVAPLRLRPAGMPIPEFLGIGALLPQPPDVLLPQPPGALLQAVGRKRSGPRRSGMAVAGLQRVDGTGQGRDVTPQPLRGETGPEAAEKPKRRTSPISDLFRARSAAQPLPGATSGRGRPERRGRSRPAARKGNSAAGAREFHGLRAFHARPRPAGRPPAAATSGRCRLGKARAALASHSAAAVRCPKLLVGVALQRSDVRSAATKSRVARRSGNCLPRRSGRCTRSG